MQNYPSEGKVSGFLWNIDYLIPVLLHYNPRLTKYNENDEQLFFPCSAPILYDLFEQMGSMLCACMKMGWKYICKCANQKIVTFINKEWYNHLLNYERRNTYVVCLLCSISILIIFFQLEHFVAAQLAFNKPIKPLSDDTTITIDDESDISDDSFGSDEEDQSDQSDEDEEEEVEEVEVVVTPPPKKNGMFFAYTAFQKNLHLMYRQR